MKTRSQLMLVSLLLVGMASVAAAQSPLVTHNTWTSGAPMPTGVRSPAAAVLKNEMYLIGGLNSSGTIIADTQIYNPVTNTWSTGAPLPTAVDFGVAAVVKNVLYIFGGTGDDMTPTNAVWAYHPKTKTWTAEAAMPTARWGAAAVVEKKTDIIYVIGGAQSPSGNGFVATVESYDPATNTWTEQAPMSVARADSASGLLGTTIVVADGGANGQVASDDNEGYDAATNSWTELKADPVGRYGSCFGSIGPELYDFGGQPTPSAAESFKLTKDAWTTALAALPQSAIFAGSAVYKKQLYCFGGWATFGGSVNNNVQIYQP